jgi:hypothetical protein
MPLPAASDIFRRLQNSIYPARPSPEVEETPNIYEVTDGSALTTEIPLGRAFGHAELTNAGVVNGATMSSSLSEDLLTPILPSPSLPHSSHPSSPSDPLSPRLMQDTDTRRQQSSNSKIASSDIDAQMLLRKRILEIQSLNLPEREKARRVQVALTHLDTPLIFS